MGRRFASLLTVLIGLIGAADQAAAQWPNWAAKPVRPRIDVIPPLGNHLPYSHAARLNRPSYLVGKSAYMIEPSSREAMAWQRAKQRGHYANHAPRMVTHYLYPKPWEVLGTGPRPRNPDDPSAPLDPVTGQPTLVQLATPWVPTDDQTLTETDSAPSPTLPSVGAGRLELAPALDLTSR